MWEALDWIIPRAPNLGGVVFEVLEQAFEPLGIEAMRFELEGVRAVWARHRTARAA